MSSSDSAASFPRVVSLLPSATEIVCALGAEAGLVGVSHECDFPSSVTDRPALTRARVSDEGSSLRIDRTVREIVNDALSVYTVDHELLGRLSPHVVVTQDLCEVCAVSLDDVRAAVARLSEHAEVDIVSLRPTRLEHILDDVERVAAALGRAEHGVRLRGELATRIESIRRRTRDLSPRPRVASLEWIDPIMLGGTWMPEVIDVAGGIAVGADVGAPAPTVSPDELAALDPDLVVVKACGFDVARTMHERNVIEDKALRSLAPTCRVYVTDGNAFFNRPGPRIVESIEIMAALTHPSVFSDFAERHADAIVRIR